MITTLPIDWIRKEEYCRVTGMPLATINNYIKLGIWLEGVHWKAAPDRRHWINLPKAQEWVTEGHLKRA